MHAIHLGVLYSGMRACCICLRSGWGSDGNVYNVLRSLRDSWKASGASRPTTGQQTRDRVPRSVILFRPHLHGNPPCLAWGFRLLLNNYAQIVKRSPLPRVFVRLSISLCCLCVMPEINPEPHMPHGTGA